MPEVYVTFIYVQPTHCLREYDVVQMSYLLERKAEPQLRTPTCELAGFEHIGGTVLRVNVLYFHEKQRCITSVFLFLRT